MRNIIFTYFCVTEKLMMNIRMIISDMFRIRWMFYLRVCWGVGMYRIGTEFLDVCIEQYTVLDKYVDKGSYNECIK